LSEKEMKKHELEGWKSEAT